MLGNVASRGQGTFGGPTSYHATPSEGARSEAEVMRLRSGAVHNRLEQVVLVLTEEVHLGQIHYGRGAEVQGIFIGHQFLIYDRKGRG